MSADQRARALELNDELRTAHHSSALQGQTVGDVIRRAHCVIIRLCASLQSAPDADTDVDLHFVAFVQRNGRLLELDGRKKVNGAAAAGSAYMSVDV